MRPFLSIIALFFFVSCSKNNITKNETNTLINTKSFDINDVKNIDGALSFKDWQDLYGYLHFVSVLNDEERIKLEDKFNFRSVSSLWKIINDAEVRHQVEDYKDINPDLSIEEYNEIGFKYEPTLLYKEYLNNGFIKEFIYLDGSRSFQPRIENSYYYNILNENFEVFVGDKKFICNNDGKLIKNDFESKAIDSYTTVLRLYGSDGGEWVTDPSNSNQRYRAKVVMASSFTLSTLSVALYWEARAEKKLLGNWNTRSNYNPIWGLSGNWSYQYMVWLKSTNTTSMINSGLPANTIPLPTSPYNISNLNTNYTLRYLYPDGFYTRTNDSYEFYNYLIFSNYNFTVKFSGGTSGYHYNL